MTRSKNKIQFTLVDAPWDSSSDRRAAINVDIDGMNLERLVSRASDGNMSGSPMSPADVLWPGRELWFGHQPDKMSGLGIRPDRVAVLVCACGGFGCGGVGAHIQIKDGKVHWSDFTSAFTKEPLAMGPFVFSEAKYRAQVEGVLDEWRRDWGSR